MKKNDNKSCKRNKCPYYEYKTCPHRKECDHSNETTWKESK